MLVGCKTCLVVAGWAQIAAYMAYCETSQDQSAGTPAAAGDLGLKVLIFSDPAEEQTSC